MSSGHLVNFILGDSGLLITHISQLFAFSSLFASKDGHQKNGRMRDFIFTIPK